MPGPKPVQIELTAREREILERIARRQTAPQRLARRAGIVLEANRGVSNTAIAKQSGITRDTVITWRSRFAEAQPHLAELAPDQLGRALEAVFADEPRSGAPSTFSAEEVARIVALACRNPEEVGRPISHWTPKALADEAEKQGIVETISARTVGRFLKRGRSEAASDPVLAVSAD